MSLLVRRAIVVVLALAMTMSLTGSALAAPRLRYAAKRTNPNPAVVIRGSGWGHGVGMSQYGAFAQSRAGWGFQRILRYYYPGVSIPSEPMPSKIRVGLHSAMKLSNVTAVGGPLPWKTCVGRTCTDVATQRRGQTWTVRLKANGDFTLTDDTGAQRWVGGRDTSLIGAFNPNAAADGTMIKAYHPTHGQRRYKWGNLEYRAKSASNQTMNLVLDIPSVDLYLRGLGEMPSGWGGMGGMAALRAQVVAARTYAVKAHRGNGGLASWCYCTLGATPLHQAYAGYDKELESAAKYWLKAIADTPGRVTTYGGQLIGSFYSSSHGGRSENIEDSYAYGTSPIPYLRSVADPWSLRAPGNSFSSWSSRVSNRSFANFVGSDMARVRRVRIVKRTAGGTPVRLSVRGRDSSGRSILRGRAGSSSSKGIVGIEMKKSFPYNSSSYSQSTLLSQQVRRVGLAPFTDDDGSASEYAHVYAYRAGIMPARTSTKFAPRGTVSRADLAYYLYRMLKLPRSSRDFFTDDNGLPQEDAINALAAARIISRSKDRQFHPGRTVTRAHTAVFFRRALGLRAASRDYFTDDNRSSAENSINAMRRRGLMYGCTKTRFCPKRKMLRGQMADLILHVVDVYR